MYKSLKRHKRQQKLRTAPPVSDLCSPHSRGCAGVCTRTGSCSLHQPPLCGAKHERNILQSEKTSQILKQIVWFITVIRNIISTRLYVIWYAWIALMREERRALGLLWERFYFAAVGFSLYTMDYGNSKSQY